MSNLLKSKFLLGVMVVATLFVGVIAVNPAKAAAANCSITSTLRVGSKGAQVQCLQTALGLTADGSFGPKTKAAVVAFQKNAGLVADGIFGAKSRAQWMANNGVGAVSFLPPGCTSAAGFSSVTGGACYAVFPSTLPAGCTSTSGYSSTTGALCATGQVQNPVYPAGCTSASGFSPSTGASCSTGAVGNQTGPVAVSLSSDNPASGYIIGGQATADLAHFTFSGSGTVTSVTLQRTGISVQDTLSNVYLYDGMTRLTDGYSFNNVGQLVMNNLSIAVNGSKTISVKADVSATASTYASSLGITLSGFTSAGNAATTANVMGNQMTIGVGSLATAVLSANQVATSAVSVNPGVMGFPIWQAPINVGIRSLWLKGANFRIIGSAPSDAIANVKMFKDGVALATTGVMTTINGTSYVTFDFSANPVELTTGGHTLDVRADIVKGSDRALQLSLQQAADLVLYDAQLGINIAVSGTVPNSTVYSITIAKGTVTVTLDPTFQAFTKVTGGATNATIAKFKLHAYGEDVKVDTLNILPVLSGQSAPVAGGLQNVTVYFNGSQIGSQTAAWTAGNIALTPGSQMILPAGVDSYLEVRADIRTTGSVNYTDGTVKANIVSGTVEGMSSKSILTAIGATTGNALTVSTGFLAVGKSTGYANQVMNQNTANVKLGSYTLQNQSSSEAVHVTSLRVTTSVAVPTYTAAGSNLVVAGAANSATINVSASPSFSVTDVITIPSSGTTYSCVVDTVVSATQLTGHCPTGSVTATAGASITDTSKTATALTYVTNLRTTETSGNGATPVGSITGSDTFQVDFLLAPGDTKTIDVMADLGAGNYGTILTKLSPQGIGAHSNVQVFANVGTTLDTGDVTGQTITMATGTLAAPVIVSSASTASQYVNAGTTGTTGATVAAYKFVSSNGNANITELKFSISAGAPVTSVTVNGQPGNVVGTTIDVPNLNLTVPNGSTGATFNVYVSYGSIGAAGIGTAVSGTLSTLTLTEVDYGIGGTSHSDTVSVASPTMKIVGARPVLTATTTSGSTLTNNGDTHLFDVTVTPTGGDITLNTLVFNVVANSAAGVTLTTPRLTDSNGTTIADFACTPYAALTVIDSTATAGAGADFTCTASAGYLLSVAKTFSLYGTPAFATFGVSPTSSITTKLKQDAGATFSWTDTTGGATVAETGDNTSYLKAYPTATWSAHN